MAGNRKKTEDEKLVDSIKYNKENPVGKENERKGGLEKKGNLINLSERSKEDALRIQKMGAKASVESRRKKKELRELTKTFLQQDAVGPVKANLQRLGFNTDDMTNLAAILGVLFTKVLNNADLNAARTIIEWSGMSPMQQIQENEAMQKLSMLIGAPEEEEKTDDVVFYIPQNGRNPELEKKEDVEVIMDEGEKI